MTAVTAIAADSISQLGTILSIWAHPDDETYLAGGVMAAARDGGQRVVCVSATAGEHGTPDPTLWPPDRLGRLRRWEAAAAMTILGVDDHRFLGLTDGGLRRDGHRGLTFVDQLIHFIRPDTILTFGADGITFHPDHVAVHHWVTEAWMQRDCPGRLLYAAPTIEHLAQFGELYERSGAYMTDERPAGASPHELAVSLVLDGAGLDRKVAALAAMASQTRATMSDWDPETFAASVSQESFVDARTTCRTG